MTDNATLDVRISEIAAGVHQLSTYLPDMDFAARVLPVDALRWIAFGHVEADECGAMN